VEVGVGVLSAARRVREEEEAYRLNLITPLQQDPSTDTPRSYATIKGVAVLVRVLLGLQRAPAAVR
jgi:hypothetical protein